MFIHCIHPDTGYVIDGSPTIHFNAIGTSLEYTFSPSALCFANTAAGDETLLISDASCSTSAVVEISTAGHFTRSIDVASDSISTRRHFCVAFAPRGMAGGVVATSFDALVSSSPGIAAFRGAIRLFCFESGDITREIPDIGALACLTFSLDGVHLLASEESERVLEISTNSGEVARYPGIGECRQIVFDSDGNVVAAHLNTVCLYGNGGAPVLASIGHPSSCRITSLARLGPHICCMAWGKMHVIRNDWPASARAAWVSACV